MRALDLAPFAFAVALIVPAAHAAETPHDIKGLYLMTDYPAVTVRPGTTSNIPLRLQNYGLRAAALPALGRGRAERLDRDAAGRRPTGRGGDAGAGRQCRASASPRRAGQCRSERADR